MRQVPGIGDQQRATREADEGMGVRRVDLVGAAEDDEDVLMLAGFL